MTATSSDESTEVDISKLEPPSTSLFLSPELITKCLMDEDDDPADPQVQKNRVATTPFFVYSLQKLNEFANICLRFPNAYGLTVRYAMKACPNRAVLQFFDYKNIHIDASSGFEVRRAIAAKIPPEHISLSTQELPMDFGELLDMGVKMNACSLRQLRLFGKYLDTHPDPENVSRKVGIRLNPGVGSGGFSSSTTSFSKTNVGGPSSSFGIWYELVEDGSVKKIIDKYDIEVERIHTHIGSGSDPAIWQQVAARSLSFCEKFDTVTTLNLGGGFKVDRVNNITTTNMQEVGKPVKELFEKFKEDHGRELHLEIEPGTFLVAMAGSLVSRVMDKVKTSEYTFLKLDSGMTDVLRPSLYGAIHPITILPKSGKTKDVGLKMEKAVVVGHCCESGDLLTPKDGEPESLDERVLREAKIGDFAVIDGCGAYCAGMAAINYNSFPRSAEIMMDGYDCMWVVRKAQTLEQILEGEWMFPVLLTRTIKDIEIDDKPRFIALTDEQMGIEG